jgi:hypothetical protein
MDRDLMDQAIDAAAWLAASGAIDDHHAQVNEVARHRLTMSRDFT